MNILIAPDSFKGSLTASEVAQALEKGIKAVKPDANIVSLPLSDGGEGMMESILKVREGKFIASSVEDPLGRRVNAAYLQLENQTAGIELASASGLPLLKENEKDPKITSTYGTGQLIREALLQGNERLIIGLGGSATNDGGAGIIQALGGRFLNKSGSELERGGMYLSQLSTIDLSELMQEARDCKIILACDVKNPLTGSTGATRTYGPQKGATSMDLEVLEYSLIHYASVLAEYSGINTLNMKGAGAAGGTSAGLHALLGAELQSGFDVIADMVDLEKHIREADLVITGEGKLDEQSSYGKVPVSVSEISKHYGKPVIGVSGIITVTEEQLTKMGFESAYSLIQKTDSEEKAIANANSLLIQIAQEATQNFLKLHELN